MTDDLQDDPLSLQPVIDNLEKALQISSDLYSNVYIHRSLNRLYAIQKKQQEITEMVRTSYTDRRK